MDAAWIGLLGTALGAVITQSVTWMTRRQDQVDRRRDALIARAEELAALVAELGPWQVKSFQAAVAGENELPPWSLFRLQVLVTVYLPELKASAQLLHTAIAELQNACSDVAAIVRGQPGQHPELASLENLKSAMKSLTVACVKITDAIGEQMRAAQVR